MSNEIATPDPLTGQLRPRRAPARLRRSAGGARDRAALVQTPWSLAMFVLELSKPSGICLGIDDGRGGLTGYLVCSRYADVWHLMNIAVAPERGGQGIATVADGEPVRRRRAARLAITLEVRTSNAAAIGDVRALRLPRRPGHRRRYYHDNGEDALIMWLEPASRRLSPASLAAPSGVILALETSCDDTCAAVVDGGAIRSNVISSQAAAARALRRRRARGRLAPPPRADQPGRRRRARRTPGSSSARSTRSRSPAARV